MISSQLFDSIIYRSTAARDLLCKDKEYLDNDNSIAALKWVSEEFIDYIKTTSSYREKTMTLLKANLLKQWLSCTCQKIATWALFFCLWDLSTPCTGLPFIETVEAVFFFKSSFVRIGETSIFGWFLSFLAFLSKMAQRIFHIFCVQAELCATDHLAKTACLWKFAVLVFTSI